jgi:hypothetical protein
MEPRGPRTSDHLSSSLKKNKQTNKKNTSGLTTPDASGDSERPGERDRWNLTSAYAPSIVPPPVDYPAARPKAMTRTYVGVLWSAREPDGTEL